MLVNGTIGSTTIASSGTGSVYVLGSNTSVGVDLQGVSNVYLRNDNRKSHIRVGKFALRQFAGETFS